MNLRAIPELDIRSLPEPGPEKMGPGLNIAGPTGPRTPSAINDVSTFTTGSYT